MNNEKYPGSFIIAFSIYLTVLVIFILGFLIPSISLNLWSDSGYYWLIGVTFLPLAATLLYSKSSRFPFLWGKEALIRYFIIILCIVSIIINGILVLPLAFVYS